MRSPMNWLDRNSFISWIAVYVAAMIISLLGAVLFFFPLLPVFTLLGWEFSNLGPIATFFWGLLFDVFVITPLFVCALIIKLARRPSES